MPTPSYDLFVNLEGPIQLEYKPTPRSRKWRQGPIRMIFCQQAYDDAITLAKQEGWHTWRYVHLNW